MGIYSTGVRKCPNIVIVSRDTKTITSQSTSIPSYLKSQGASVFDFPKRMRGNHPKWNLGSTFTSSMLCHWVLQHISPLFQAEKSGSDAERAAETEESLEMRQSGYDMISCMSRMRHFHPYIQIHTHTHIYIYIYMYHIIYEYIYIYMCVHITCRLYLIITIEHGSYIDDLPIKEAMPVCQRESVARKCDCFCPLCRNPMPGIGFLTVPV